MAYIGGDQAVMDLPSFRLKGRGAGVLWRGWETWRQISSRNKALVAFDWLRTRLFGKESAPCRRRIVGFHQHHHSKLVFQVLPLKECTSFIEISHTAEDFCRLNACLEPLFNELLMPS